MRRAACAVLVISTFPDETGPAYLLRDRDAIYGVDSQRRVERMGILPSSGAPLARFARMPLGSGKVRAGSADTYCRQSRPGAGSAMKPADLGD